MNSKTDKLVKIIEKYLEKLDIEGICGFFVLSDSEDYNDISIDKIQVILVLDEDYLDKEEIDRQMFTRKSKSNIYRKIQDYFGIDVYVGSLVKKC